MKKIILILALTNCSSISYSQTVAKLSLSEKIYGLSKFWSDANYNFVYLYKINPEEWNKGYTDAIDAIQNGKQICK